MSDSSAPEPGNEPSILRRFASLIGLLGVSLFFTGWIYRWAYFLNFHLEITTLEFSVESFLIVPIQVFFADSGAIGRTAIAFSLTLVQIYTTLLAIGSIVDIAQFYHHRCQRYWSRKSTFLYRLIYTLLQFKPFRFDSIKVLRSLIDEIVIVSWVLIILFILAQSQAIRDAQRDMGRNSTLPVVTFIVPEDRIPIGAKLNDPGSFESSVEGFRFFGDFLTYQGFQGQEKNDTFDPDDPERVWRLLLERDGWIYLIQTNPGQEEFGRSHPVVALQKSMYGDQVMILAPDFVRPEDLQ
ncbi:hypothetical protein [Roseofilum casamattae]|uniref:Uncharacterized protein n=1 Tax=Roseofilum casamattae BLCC-M143 TaxID=3022442 RepID=A0ABT7C135_9CYAN|nr:hypothetical protein [Roseofilum casamattae]MDJ1185140.1 hypothetical protein [Roseofilum casamattae BLCC-M143]